MSLTLSDIPQSELNTMLARFTSTSSADHRPPNAPFLYNNIARLRSGRRVRIAAFNGASLLPEYGAPDFESSYKPGSVTLDTFASLSNSGQNIVHTIAFMTCDAFIAYMRFSGKSFEESKGLALNLINETVESSEYRPHVSVIRNFLSECGITYISNGTVKKVMACFMSLRREASDHSNNGKVLTASTILGGAGVGILTLLCPPCILLGLPFVATGYAAHKEFEQSDDYVRRAVELGKVGNYCMVLTQFRDSLLNSPDDVAQSNVCVIAFDDFSDFHSQEPSFFQTKADVLQSYHNWGGMCSFMRVPGASSAARPMGEYENEDGQKILDFYRDVFHRMSTARSVHELTDIRDVLKGCVPPEPPIEDPVLTFSRMVVKVTGALLAPFLGFGSTLLQSFESSEPDQKKRRKS